MKLSLADHDLPPLPDIAIGVYRHYKGNLYRVEGVCMHSETLEPLVIYTPLYETPIKTWVRPYDMFTGTIEIDGKEIPRFEFVER